MTKLIMWDGSNDKQDILDALERVKDKIKQKHITRNKEGIWILWIDRKSREKLWNGK